MKNFSIRKILAIVLMLAMVVSVMTPLSVLSPVAAEAEEPFHYAPAAFSKEQLIGDGWVATKNDGTAITTYDESIYAGAARDDFWWRFNSDGSVQGQGNVDCEDNFGKAQQALTYTGKWLNEFNLKFYTNVTNYNHRVSFSIGVKNPGEYYNDETSPSNVITFTTNPETSHNVNINRLQIKGAALKDGTAECKVVGTNDDKYYWNVKVYNNHLYVACNDNSYEFELNDNYEGGYFAINSPNSYAKYFPPTINTIVDSDSEYKVYAYSTNQLNTDGWVATKTSGDGASITTYDNSVYNAGKRNEFWWRFGVNAGGEYVAGFGDTDCESNFGKAYQSLTYTGKEYQNLNLKFKTGARGWHAGIGFSVGVKNAGELYLDENSPSNVITVMTSLVANTGDITQFTVKGAALANGAQTCSITKDSANLFNWDVTVLGKLLVIKCNESEYQFALNENYVGGYIQLTSPNTYSAFYPVTVSTDNLSVDGIAGDVNMDTVINAEDLSLLKKVLLGLEEGYGNSDANGDGFVDIRDMVNIKKQLVVLGLELTTETAEFNELYSDGLVKTAGRAGMVDGSYHMAQVNSGFEITGIFEGDVTLTGYRDTANVGIECFLNVIVDGEFDHCTWVGVDESEIYLIKNLQRGYHTIRVEKAYSVSCGAYVPTELTYTGILNKPSEEDKLTIEVLGDSMTDGVGTSIVDSGKAWDAANGGNNSYYSYAAVMARELDAELSAVALAGEGITNIHRKYYPYISYGQKGVYDFSAENQKDVVVINLGTNGVYDYNTKNECTAEDIKTAAYDLLVDVRKNNPDAYIIWVYGMIANDTEWYDAYKAAAADMNDSQISTLDVTSLYGSVADSYDSFHPGRYQYEAYGKYIAEYIKTLIAE